MHDPLNAYDLVLGELSQRRESGYLVDELAARFTALSPDDDEGLEALLLALQSAPPDAGWSYDEPEGIDGILRSLPAAAYRAPAPVGDLGDKVLGGWLGRIAGCNLGKPVEDGDHWTSARLREYLELADAYPLRDYIPALDPMPAGFALKPNWPHTTRGNVDGSARDDDIDYPILGLHLLEQHGQAITPARVAEAWLTLLPYRQVFTAERAAYTNLVRGVPIEQVAVTRNPYREWIGALIRGDIYGWVKPGDPRGAATLAFQDASLSHVGNGVYGEMWSAALVSAAFTERTVGGVYDEALRHVPPSSRLAETLVGVRAMRMGGGTWEHALAQIQRQYGHYSWVHTVSNAALIAAGLLWGDGDYTATVGLTVQGGWDTDSNGATAGSVMGVLNGARALPANFIEPLHDRTRSAIFGSDNSRISDLAARTVALATPAASR